MIPRGWQMIDKTDPACTRESLLTVTLEQWKAKMAQRGATRFGSVHGNGIDEWRAHRFEDSWWHGTHTTILMGYWTTGTL